MQSGQGQSVSLTPWDSQRYVRKVDPLEVRYSRGLLRCRPEKWFPGFMSQWLPLAHSLGVEVKVTEVKPVLAVPRNLKVGFAGSVDDEPIGVFTDEVSLETILEAFSPGISPQASMLVAEYAARRFLTSLALSWSGPEASVVRFESEKDPQKIAATGAVKFGCEINGGAVTVWLAMGKLLTERLDGLWRRQIRSATKVGEGGIEVRMEIAQLAVPPSMLVDYMKVGSVIDLEVPSSDIITLRHSGKGWLPARLCAVGGNLGFEVVSGPIAPQALPEGTTRVAIEFGVTQFESAMLLEMAQVGAMWDTGLPLSDKVILSINGEKVGDARLCLFEGRFAITVE